MANILTATFAPGLEGLDQQVTLWLNTHGWDCLDGLWIFMSNKFVWIPLYVLIAALLIWRLGWKKGLIAIACVGVVFFFDERANNLIKALVERVRPCNNEDMISMGLHILENGGGWSFPSGHACNTFGLAMSSSLCLLADKKHNHAPYMVFIFIWAALVGLSRIMVARHFLGDVLTGAVLGCVIGLIFGLIYLRLAEKPRS